jgi:hypothetical protein
VSKNKKPDNKMYPIDMDTLIMAEKLDKEMDILGVVKDAGYVITMHGTLTNEEYKKIGKPPAPKLCKDCIHHYPEFANHYCDRPIPNLVMGALKKLHANCEIERLDTPHNPLYCGTEGKFFEKRQNVE